MVQAGFITWNSEARARPRDRGLIQAVAHFAKKAGKFEVATVSVPADPE
jgi:hypothetical protein